ncbi:MAG: hypothetical protein NTW87_22825 [Planctomycetota bacterium]|nr:hypothetical protein [Planctomycetota bacterium]
MKLLRQHAPTTVFGFVVVLSVGFALQEHSRCPPLPADELRQCRDRIREALTRAPTPAYVSSLRAGAEGAGHPPSVLTGSARPNEPLADIPQFIAYPRPSRPLVEQPDVQPVLQDDPAVLGALSEVQGRMDSYRAILDFRLPQNLKHMKLVRVEIFRGDAPDRIETTVPYGTIEYTAKTAEEPEAAGQPARELRSSERRHAREAAQPPDTANAAERTSQHATRFVDTRIEPRRTCYYQLRTVGQMTPAPGTRIAGTDAAGRQTLTLIRPPADAQPVKPDRPGAPTDLYATALSAPVAVTSQSNCEIRFAGVIGSIPAPDADATNANPTYQGNFVVRVWLVKLQAWREATVRAGVGERIKGHLFYADPATKRTEAYEFDTGYALAGIKWGWIRHPKIMKVFAQGPNGDHLLDPFGRPVTITQEALGDPIPNEVALLKDTATGTVVECPKRSARP